jgi:acetyl esterase/lipase
MFHDRKPILEDPQLKIEEFDVIARENWPVRIRSYRDSQLRSSRLPLFIYLHGGGYVTDGLETDDASLRNLARSLPLCVLSVEYGLATEHRFPIGFEDAKDVDF